MSSPVSASSCNHQIDPVHVGLELEKPRLSCILKHRNSLVDFRQVTLSSLNSTYYIVALDMEKNRKECSVLFLYPSAWIHRKAKTELKNNYWIILGPRSLIKLSNTLGLRTTGD